MLILNDRALVGDLLSHALATDPSLEVLGVAHDVPTALGIASIAAPDIVLVKSELSGEVPGMEAALCVKRETPGAGVVVLSLQGSSKDNCGYLRSFLDLTTLIHKIQSGVGGIVVLDYPVSASSPNNKPSELASRLTQRQSEVLQLVAQGYNNAAIAKRLSLTEKTIEHYLTAIYQHLDLSGEPETHARVKATLLCLKYNNSGDAAGE
ncbi:MAG: response regulator transcription factor [Dehalococcoidia bacterium]